MDNLNTNENFREQRDLLLSIQKEIRLMSQQVDYLLRNEKPLGLLDADVLMNRTHALYDKLCSVDYGYEHQETEEDFDETLIDAITPIVTMHHTDENEKEQTIAETAQQTDNEESIPETDNDITSDEPQNEFAPDTLTNETDEIELNIVDEDNEMKNELEVDEQTHTTIAEPYNYETFDDNDTTAPNEINDMGDEQPNLFSMLGEEELPLTDNIDGVENYVMRFDDTQNEEPQPQDETITTQNQNEEPVEKVISQPIFEIVNTYEEPQGDDIDDEEPLDTANDDIDDYSKNADIEVDKEETTANDESEAGTIGEKMMTEDNSLAAKLQNRPVGNLRSAIGINDKFLFVNELFGGSMEKYNRSIENLNDIQTLNGALIYLNELKVELQWNSNNEAYKKLSSLVEHKFA